MGKHTRNSGKFNGSHTTVLDGCTAVVDAAAKMDQVVKISLGPIRALTRRGGAPLRVKCIDAPNSSKCLETKMAKGATVQTVYIYVNAPSDRDTVRKKLEGFTA